MTSKLRLTLSLIWLLSLAVVLTLLVAWLIFPWEIAELNLTTAVDLPAATIADNFNQLMAYLTNPMVSPLTMPDFPVSASGAKHFTDVKHLFLLAEGLCLGLALPALQFFHQQYISKHLTHHRRLLFILMALPFLIGGLGVLIGFDQFFTLFHTVLFPGDSSWLFHPATDPVILILPADYFLHCFFIFFLIYEGLLAGLFYLSRPHLPIQ